MSVSKHKKKERRRDRKSNRRGPILVKHPFSDIPRDVLLKALTEAADSAVSAFPEELRELVSEIQSMDGLQVIATLACYGLMGHITKDGKIEPSYKGEEFNQAHVELTQAIALQLPEDLRKPPPTSEKIQNLFDTLPKIGHAYSRRRMVALREERTQEQKAIGLLQEHLRLHTQVIRNWGYFDRVVRITSDLCRPIDAVLRRVIGIGGTQLINAFLHLVRTKEEKINAHRSKLRVVFQQGTLVGMIEKYYELNTQLRDKPQDLIAFAERGKLSKEQLKVLLLTHSNLFLAEELFVDIPSTAAEVGVSGQELRSALDCLSLRFGELRETNSERLFLENPVWLRPIIKCRREQYFCAIPQSFFSFIFPILDRLLSEDAVASRAYSRRRAEFLESEIKRVFQAAFPDCEISEKYRWKEGGEEFENDLLVRIDSHLIVVEAKSGSISWPALRGAPERAKKHVEELLLAPSHQSLRLMQRLTEAINSRDKFHDLLPAFPIDPDKIKNVLRVSVTLEDFAVLQTNMRLAREAGWSGADHPIAPCILLADLEIIFDVLELTALKIHYLKRRAEIQSTMRYHGDELDLLGLYLGTGFNIGDAEFDGTHLELVLMSKPIDEYYIALSEGVTRPKPRPKLTTLWRDIFVRLEERNFYQWSDVAVVVLAFSHDEQKKLEKCFAKIRKNVQKNWRQPNHECSINIILNRHRSDALSFFAFRDRDKERRREAMQNIASQVFESEHVERCVILAVNIDREDYPYSTLMVFFRDHESDSKQGSDVGSDHAKST